MEWVDCVARTRRVKFCSKRVASFLASARSLEDDVRVAVRVDVSSACEGKRG